MTKHCTYFPHFMVLKSILFLIALILFCNLISINCYELTPVWFSDIFHISLIWLDSIALSLVVLTCSFLFSVASWHCSVQMFDIVICRVWTYCLCFCVEVRHQTLAVHRTGWCLAPVVTTYPHRGGIGTTAGKTVCREKLTSSSSTARWNRYLYIPLHHL